MLFPTTASEALHLHYFFLFPSKHLKLSCLGTFSWIMASLPHNHVSSRMTGAALVLFVVLAARLRVPST